MAYVRTNWDETTAITPERLNNIEQGIVDAENNIATGKGKIATALGNMNQTGYDQNNTFDELAAGIEDISNDATAAVGDVLAGKTFYQGGVKRTGTMPNRGQQIITPGSANIAIPDGYHDGTGYVKAVTFDASKVLEGTTIAGTAGTMPNRGAYNITPGAANKAIPAGYHNGSGVVYGDADLVAGNIKNGVSIFGVTGSLTTPVLQANGTVATDANGMIEIRGLSFQPKAFHIEYTPGSITGYGAWIDGMDYYIESYNSTGPNPYKATPTIYTDGFAVYLQYDDDLVYWTAWG